MWFLPIDKSLLFTKNDKEDPRMGDFVQLATGFNEINDFKPSTADFHIHGYSDDEGIAMNGGRTGAQTGPRQIRTFLYKMTPRLGSTSFPKMTDLGDVSIQVPLEQRHERARALVRSLTENNKTFLSFGGGHDYGYADACGFLDKHQGDAVVINFDAHLDVRPTDKGFHSGTPFRRMLEEFKGKVDFYEFGLQDQCNSQTHFDWAQQNGAKLFTMRDQANGLLPLMQKALSGLEGKKLFISLDMDAFSSTEAPGCSQSWVTGMKSEDFLPALGWLVKSFDVAGLGIYETSPPLDYDNHTSKLAALVAHKFIFDMHSKASAQ